MFSITELVESKGYKNFMKYVYGWGASVVLIGALFKIMHFPGAAAMLTAGLTIEALIFFFSAFEPLHEELDWTLVYPELAGLTDEFDDDDQIRKFDRAQEMPQVVGVPVGGAVAGAAVAGVAAVEGAVAGGSGGGVAYAGGGSPSALLKFDEMLEKADIGPEIFDKLGEGLNNLSKTASKLNDLGDAGSATKDFVSKMQGAADSASELGETYQKSTEAVSASVSNLSEAYVKSAQTFDESSAQLTEAYTTFADKLTQEIDTVGSEGSAYSEKLGSLNTHLAALNSVYELQVNNMNDHVSQSSQYFDEVKNIADNLKKTAESTIKVDSDIEELRNKISDLNSIYGNMLSSLNINK